MSMWTQIFEIYKVTGKYKHLDVDVPASKYKNWVANVAVDWHLVE